MRMFLVLGNYFTHKICLHNTAKETLQNVGCELGISHNRVKILEERALRKLNIPMSDVMYNRNNVLKVIEQL